MAGLPLDSASVCVGPPLFESGPSCGFLLSLSDVTLVNVHPLVVPRRLWPPDDSVP